MDYLKFLVYASFLGAIFCILAQIIFFVVQIPFALIHRYAVYAVLEAKFYLTSLFFASFARSFSDSTGAVTFILIIIGAFCNLVYNMRSVKSELEKDDGNIIVLLLSSTLIFPFMIYFSGVAGTLNFINEYINLFLYAYDLPAFGIVLTIITWVFGLGFLVFNTFSVWYAVMKSRAEKLNRSERTDL